MCRCGVSCDYIYNKLMYAENEGKKFGYRLSVDMLFPEDEFDRLGLQSKDIASLPAHNET